MSEEKGMRNINNKHQQQNNNIILQRRDRFLCLEKQYPCIQQRPPIVHPKSPITSLRHTRPRREHHNRTLA
jgi:hypothetical protein